MDILDIINSYKPYRYLEIGIFRGDTFFQVKSEIRVGVDPVPMIDLVNLGARLEADYLGGTRTLIYPVTSDYWFKDVVYKFDLFDVVFVDGFHEHKQALRDIENAMNVLSEGGVILVHDVSPQNKEASIVTEDIKAVHGLVGFEWNGDVWKAILELKERGVQFETLDVPYGLTVIKKQAIKPGSENLSWIADLEYEHLEKNRKEILNLKNG